MSETEGRHLRLATPRVPDLVTYYTIEGLEAYQFESIDEVLQSARLAMQQAINPIVIRRAIVDKNFPASNSQEQAQLFTDAPADGFDVI